MYVIYTVMNAILYFLSPALHPSLPLLLLQLMLMRYQKRRTKREEIRLISVFQMRMRETTNVIMCKRDLLTFKSLYNVTIMVLRWRSYPLVPCHVMSKEQHHTASCAKWSAMFCLLHYSSSSPSVTDKDWYTIKKPSSLLRLLWEAAFSYDISLSANILCRFLSNF